MADRRYWLFKSEPGAYSFSDLQGEEEQTAEWTACATTALAT